MTDKGYGPVTCRICDKVTAGRVPARGDGSALFPTRHKKPDGSWCDGHNTEARGEGDHWAAFLPGRWS